MTDDELFKNITVLSLEQAIVVPYFTYKMALEGANVIRIENPERHDPNRLVGDNILNEYGMNTYFLTINSGKKAITLNLKNEKGKNLLYKLIKKLNVDIFVTNQLPKNYKKLGIDYETLKSVKPDIIWIGVTGFGPESNEGAYDPILQARSGLMDVTGEPDGAPQVLGIPLPDMGSSEMVFGLTMKALYKRAISGEGSKIDFSMFESSVSWHAINIPMVATFKKKITRRGNTHEFFAPVSVYKTKDGYIYIAVGNNRQWDDFVKLPGFEVLNRKEYKLNEGRIKDVVNLNKQIEEITRKFSTDELLKMLNKITVPASKINKIEDVLNDQYLQGKFIETEDAKTKFKITLSPPGHNTDFLNKVNRKLSFPPRLGEHNEEIYKDLLGLTDQEITQLKNEKII